MNFNNIWIIGVLFIIISYLFSLIISTCVWGIATLFGFVLGFQGVVIFSTIIWVVFLIVLFSTS